MPAPPESSKSASSPLRKLTVQVGFFLVLGYVVYRAQAGETVGTDDVQSANGMAFRESAVELGADFQHTPPSVDTLVDNIAAQITAVGAGVSVVDANSDGWPDLYAVSSGHETPNGLFLNDGTGHFRESAASAGLADLNRDGEGCSMGSVWADIDNDGDQDVFVYAWGQSRLFRNEGDAQFADITSGSGLERWMNSNNATFFDFDRDGVLDLFVGGYFAAKHDLWNLETSAIMHDSFEFSHNGGQNRLYRGLGEGRFEDITERCLPDRNRWTYAAVAADFDRDGWQDLYVANDYGEEELLLNREGERFEFAEGIGLEGESKSGMCVALGDVVGDGRLCVYVTNISKRGYLFQGNNLRASYLDRNGKMMQIAGGAAADCGWAWGAQFGDLDNDGHQDIVVANGFISASQERDYWYQMSKLGQANSDVIADAARWPAFEDRSLSGYERTRVLHNLGLRGARFREVGQAVGVTDRYDGRAVALADLNGNGLLDLVIAAQGGPLLIYSNESETEARWIGFSLTGTRSNRDAIGAEVTLEVGERTQVRVVTTFSGFASQSDRRLHFGLGNLPADSKLTARIRWPSGQVETLTELSPDRVHRIEEQR